MTVGLCAQAMADNGETKGLIRPPPKVSLHNYCTFESVHDGDHNGVEYLWVLLNT